MTVKKRKRNETERLAQTSSTGRFRNVYGVVSRPTIGRNGRANVIIHGKSYGNNRVVWTAFGGKAPSASHQADHINGDTTDDSAKNLRWLTRSANIQSSYDINPNRKSNAPKLSKPIMGREVGTEGWVSYDSGNDAGRKLGIYVSSISACANKKCKTAKDPSGKVFEFQYDQPAEPPLLEGEEWGEFFW
jgi:hypothetical protein